MGILLDANVADPTAAGGAMGSIVMAVLVYGLFFLAMWFFLFRPQGKEKREWQRCWLLWPSGMWC